MWLVVPISGGRKMTMIERVARALAVLTDWETELSPGEKSYWLEHARIAIEVMREPTEEMVYAAMVTPYPTVKEAGGMLPQAKEAVRLEWQAMIDAALSDLSSCLHRKTPA
jgi:hypothetical protein